MFILHITLNTVGDVIMIKTPVASKRRKNFKAGQYILAMVYGTGKIAEKKGVRTKNMHHHSRCC